MTSDIRFMVTGIHTLNDFFAEAPEPVITTFHILPLGVGKLKVHSNVSVC